MLIQDRYCLRAFNTFGFRSSAEHYAEAGDERTVSALLAHARAQGWPVFILGGGSNIVLARDVPGLTIRLTDGTVRVERSLPDGDVLLSAGAGVGWDSLVIETLERGLAGLENLSLIPGTAGAAPVQNIGAYGVELADRLHSVGVWHRPTHRRMDLSAEECEFGYRSSRFKREPGDWVILMVTLRLGPSRTPVTGYASLAAKLHERGLTSPTATEIADAVRSVRAARLPDPSVLGNAGSFFQNPIVQADQAAALALRFPSMVQYPQPDGQVKLAAAWLIDQQGFRGCRVGGIGVHRHQALVLVNHGGGTSSQLLTLVSRIVEAVRTRFGVTLVPEPLIV